MTDIPLTDEMAGKTVFIAGGTSGINLGIAIRFAGAGASLAVASRSSDNVTNAVNTIESMGGTAIGHAVDVRDYDSVKRSIDATVEKFGSLDVVVSGAAGNFVAPAAELSSNGFKTVVDIDLLGTFNVFRASSDHLHAGDASLIAISAPQSTVASPYQAHVCAAKAGVDHLTRALAVEWGSRGIRVNAIVPGPIADTVGMEKLAPTDEAKALVAASVPLKRFGTVDEIADLALFLSSGQAQYITGAVIPCDGGMSLTGIPGPNG